MISVVISTYNRPEMLKRAIQSVINQTYKDWELIIVDDHSLDRFYKDTLDIPDPRITYFYRDSNFGNDTQPKNDGIKLSKGEYITFLDDDNEFMPDHLMTLIKTAEQNPDVDVIYGDRMIVSDDDPDFEPQIGVHSDFSSAILVTKNFIDTSDVLIKREALFLVGGFDERYKKYIDWNLWVRMAKANCKFLRVPKVITYYHLHKQMKSVTVKDSHIGEKPFGNINPTPIFRPAWDFFELEIQLPYLGEIKPPKVAIYTLTMNRLDYTKKMYESLQKAGYPFDWFVVDNGSTDGTVKWLESLPRDNIHALFNRRNKGISIASNQALDVIGDKYDFIIKIDNDCEILSDDWLKELLHITEAHWTLCLSPYVEGLVDNPGGVPRMHYKTLRKHMLGIVPHLGGIFTIAHKSAYKDFRWEENDFLHGMQDTIFSQEMQKKGYLLAYVEDMRVMHMDTTQGQKERYPDYFERRKWERTHRYQK